jgi:hypothetical protein
MKYNNKIYDFSFYLSDNESKQEMDDKIIVKKQEIVLELILRKIEKQISMKLLNKNGNMILRFEETIYSDFNDGYREILELINTNNLDTFLSDYCMYLGSYNSTCDEYHNAYIEILWDYKSYFKQVNDDMKLKLYK